MNRTASILAAIALCFSMTAQAGQSSPRPPDSVVTAPSATGLGADLWPGLSQDSNVQQVLQAVPEAVDVRQDPAFSKQCPVKVEDYVIKSFANGKPSLGLMRARVCFQFDGNAKLQQITVSPMTQGESWEMQYNYFKAMVSKKHGSPHANSGSNDDATELVQWQLPDRNIRLYRGEQAGTRNGHIDLTISKSGAKPSPGTAGISTDKRVVESISVDQVNAAQKDRDAKPELRLASDCAAKKADACTTYGLMLMIGTPTVVRDEVSAVVQFEIGCRLGHAPGCRAAGMANESGKGAIVDVAKALAFYERGCSGKDANSCYRAGALHATGKGGSIDLPRALTYFSAGCELKDATSCETKNSLAAHLSAKTQSSAK